MLAGACTLCRQHALSCPAQPGAPHPWTWLVAAENWPVVLKPLIGDLARSEEGVCPALGGTVDVFWVHLVTGVCFSFLQRVAREPSSLSRGKVPALPALPTAEPPLEQQRFARVETAFSGQTRTPQTVPAPVSPALGEEGRCGGSGGLCPGWRGLRCAHAGVEPGMGAHHP